MNVKAGNIIQIIIPIVDPTRPSTTSILGISNPVPNENITINMVKHLKRGSGM